MVQAAHKPVPGDMRTVTVHLYFNGNCEEAVEFYQKAFGATLACPVMHGPGGKGVMHAMLKFGDSYIMMGDACSGQSEKGPADTATAGLWLYVDDCDAAFHRAVDAGCQVLMAVNDAFWGDRFGKVRDPYGHCWSLATHKWELTPEEMSARQEEFLHAAAGASA